MLEEEGVGALVQAEGNEIHVEVPKEGLELLSKIRNLLSELQGDKVEDWVSLDGKSYVAMEKLQASKQQYIEAEDGVILPTKDLAVFLENKMHGQASFDFPQQESRGFGVIHQLEKEQFLKEAELNLEIPSQIEFEGLPATILFLAANPGETSRISWKDEHSFIATKLIASIKEGQYELLPKDAVSLDDILDAIEDTEPHILHFCGHGREETIDRDGAVGQKGGIVVHSEDKRTYEVLDAELLDNQFRVLKKDLPQLKIVFLNACHSRSQALAISKHGIYAIGTNDEILSSAARLFAAGFYRRLSKSGDILAAINGGINRAIKADKNIESLIRLYYNGQRLYPSKL